MSHWGPALDWTGLAWAGRWYLGGAPNHNGVGSRAAERRTQIAEENWEPEYGTVQ